MSINLISKMKYLKLFSISLSSHDPSAEELKVFLAGTAGG
jgi:hypothetical protein